MNLVCGSCDHISYLCLQHGIGTGLGSGLGHSKGQEQILFEHVGFSTFQ